MSDYKTVDQQLKEVEKMAAAEAPVRTDLKTPVVEVAPGVIVPAGPRQVTAQEVSDMIRGVAGRMYDGKDPRKAGMTLIEAALFECAVQAAEHGGEDLDRLLNRVLGKPLQQIASVSTTATLKEFLDHIIAAEGRVPIPEAKVVETSAVVEDIFS